MTTPTDGTGIWEIQQGGRRSFKLNVNRILYAERKEMGPNRIPQVLIYMSDSKPISFLGPEGDRLWQELVAEKVVNLAA